MQQNRKNTKRDEYFCKALYVHTVRKFDEELVSREYGILSYPCIVSPRQEDWNMGVALGEGHGYIFKAYCVPVESC